MIGWTTSHRPGPELEVHRATKAAVRNCARSWAKNARELGMRVKVLSPGPTDTTALRGLVVAAEEQDAYLRRFGESIPIGPAGQATEVAAAWLHQRLCGVVLCCSFAYCRMGAAGGERTEWGDNDGCGDQPCSREKCSGEAHFAGLSGGEGDSGQEGKANGTA